MDYKKPQSTIVQGDVGIYPLTTADQVILADGSRLEKDGKISADSASDSSKLGGKAPEYYLQPRNLLDNSDFTNPVNQRGMTSYTGSNYSIDRWFLRGAELKLDVVDGGIQPYWNGTTSPPYFDQIIPSQVVSNADLGKMFTYALNIDDTIYCGTGILSDVCATVETPLGLAAIQYSNNSQLFVARINFDTSERHTIKWAALYEGSYTADTLPPYVPKGYAAELIECQRYFYSVPGESTVSYTGYSSSTTNARITIMTPVPMRVKPTLTIESVSSMNIYTHDTPAKTVTGVSVVNRNGNAVTLNATTSGLTAWTVCSARFNTGLTLSADL